MQDDITEIRKFVDETKPRLAAPQVQGGLGDSIADIHELSVITSTLTSLRGQFIKNFGVNQSTPLKMAFSEIDKIFNDTFQEAPEFHLRLELEIRVLLQDEFHVNFQWLKDYEVTLNSVLSKRSPRVPRDFFDLCADFQTSFNALATQVHKP